MTPTDYAAARDARQHRAIMAGTMDRATMRDLDRYQDWQAGQREPRYVPGIGQPIRTPSCADGRHEVCADYLTRTHTGTQSRCACACHPR